MEEELEEQNELFEVYKITADPGQKPLRIDKFLLDRLEDTSRNKIQEAAKLGNVLVDGKVVKSNYKVKPGDIVTVVYDYPKEENELIPQNIPLNILYEDDFFLIVNKQAGESGVAPRRPVSSSAEKS